MAKFHVNEKGVVSLCSAKIKCRLGGESGTENHFDSIDEAREAYEATMKNSLHSSLKKESTASKDKYAQESEEFHRKNKEYNESRAAVEKSRRVVDGIARKNPKFKHSRKWFDMIQKEKLEVYRRNRLHSERMELMSEETKKQFEEAKQVRKEFTPNPDFQYHPEIESSKDEKAAFSALAAYSGRNMSELSASIQSNIDSGMSKTEAYRKVWSESGLRKDKPIVSIDLEVASSQSGRVDTGRYSSIIEVGYVKVMPDGTTTEKKYLCGVPEDLKKVDGTGAEHIHHISPEMVEGKKVFAEDSEKQRELLKDLDGAVMIAHNASYESSQFSHNLYGFNRLRDEGRVEILDTRDVVKYYLPEAPNNSNESFVETTGSKYEGAHRALDDAKMTLTALMNMKKNK